MTSLPKFIADHKDELTELDQCTLEYDYLRPLEIDAMGGIRDIVSNVIDYRINNVDFYIEDVNRYMSTIRVLLDAQESFLESRTDLMKIRWRRFFES